MPASNQTGRRQCAAPSCTGPVHRQVALHALTVAGWLPRWCLPAASAGRPGSCSAAARGPLSHPATTSWRGPASRSMA